MPDMESLKLEGTMARKIKCTLSASGLEEMRNQILAYSNDLQRKCQILVSKLSKLGLDVVRQTMESIPSEEKGSYHTEVINASNGDIIGAAIRLSGDKVLFLEFSVEMDMEWEHTQVKDIGILRTDGGGLMKTERSTTLMVTGRICRCIMPRKRS